MPYGAVWYHLSNATRTMHLFGKTLNAITRLQESHKVSSRKVLTLATYSTSMRRIVDVMIETTSELTSYFVDLPVLQTTDAMVL